MQKLSNEQLGEFYRRANGILERLENGGLEYNYAVSALQQVSEGKVQLNQSAPATATPAIPPTILNFVKTVTIPATTEKFVAGRNFLLKQDGGICSYLGDNFRSWFLEGDGKTEEPHAETVLRCHKFRQNSVDGPVIAELGGETVSETTLAEMLALLKKQANGQKGALMTSGYANIFYVRDQFGILRAVGAYWDDGGWSVYASAVSSPDAWYAGSQGFSRNPSGSL